MERANESAARRRARLPAALLFAAALLLAGISLFLAGAGSERNVARAAGSRSTRLVNLASDGVPLPTWTPTPTPSPTPTPRSRLSSLQGLSVWSDGDSTSYFVSVAIYDLFSAAGGIPVAAPEYKISSGLINTGFFDWDAYADQQMALYKPDVAVFMIGANDARSGMDLEDYRTRVDAMMDHLYAPGRLVVWVAQPTMGRPDLAVAVPPINEVFRQEAAKRPWVLYVDAWTLTAGASGGFSTYLVDESGATVLARADDGVHLSPAGGRIIAQGVIAAILGR